MTYSLDGYVRVACATPYIRVADCAYNAEQILSIMKKAEEEGVKLLCMPELTITGYTCGDLFLQEILLRNALSAMSYLVEKSRDIPLIVVAGMPFAHNGKLFNTAAVFGCGNLLGIVPKTNIPNYSEFYELRHFSPAPQETRTVHLCGRDVLFGTRIIFQCENEPGLKIAAEICEDLWVPVPPSSSHATAGASVIVNLSASDETIGKSAYRRSLVSGQSARLVCAYLYADAGIGESSTDMVFASHNLVCENGAVLSESPPFAKGWAVSEIDLRALEYDRRRINTWTDDAAGYSIVSFSLDTRTSELIRHIAAHPFVPDDEREKHARCEAILDMQTAGLEKRILHTGAKTVVIGISGGLDSCLALLVAYRTIKKLDRPMSDILAVTMPCFGTTERTKSNAVKLCSALGVVCREIDISDSVRGHLRDIGISDDTRDIVYENAQARIRTLVLMDLANHNNGIVIGTGDLSELALGWTTYNGDHMSMYGVNSGIPKTLVKHIIKHAADTAPVLTEVLDGILSTPVSPELLPPTGDEINQRTENIIGPYELHDFFLYYVVRWGMPPARVYSLCRIAFEGKYSPEEILDWLRLFYRRFFAAQFKRSCLPDGPKIGSVTLSPRGDWRMPSDAVSNGWLSELCELK
ncbi:MAG: NAD(+) synthase [Synergistaceae bacterium]|jgi:NAD+ synthase (glutamine-hydrolysing)|nr:NAD(+) synthase [Synergistaceae bacterium]